MSSTTETVQDVVLQDLSSVEAFVPQAPMGITDVHVSEPHHKRSRDEPRFIIDEEEERKRARCSTIKLTPAPPKKLNNEQWDEMYQRLAAYKARYGHCLVPKRYVEDPKLGTWVETQRVQYKKLTKADATGGTTEAVTPNNRLNAERLARLEEIGFAWSAKHIRKVKAPAEVTMPAAAKPKKTGIDAVSRANARQRLNDVQWEEMYERLVAYKQKHGNCLVPKKFEENPKLASWVETQRNLYNRDYKTINNAKEEPQSPASAHAASAVAAAAAIDPTPVDSVNTKSPEEWAIEMQQAADHMAEAAMEVVNEVVDPPGLPAQHHREDMQKMGGDTIGPAAVEAATAGVSNVTLVEAGEESKMMPLKRLSEERVAKLDAIGFVWSLRSKRVDDHWDQMYAQLVKYKEEFGDCLVPSRYEKNFKLGKWVETQRYEYTKLQRAEGGASVKDETTGEGEESAPLESESKGGKQSNPRLTEERRRRLEAIGFEWKVKHKMKRYYDRQWQEMLSRLLEFKRANGHCLVPKRYPPDLKLGTWVHTQRIQYRKLMQGTSFKKEDDAAAFEENGEEQSFRLTEERRRQLEEVGFVWSARDTDKTNAEPARVTRNSYDDQWDQMFQRLHEYKSRTGDCLVPKRYKEDPKLGTWVDTQRVQYKKMKKQLDKESVACPGPDPVVGTEGGIAEGGELGSRKSAVGRLTADRILRLEGLGFVWSLRDDWARHYRELVEYKNEFGHCLVPARYSKNKRLGIWVSAQRQQYKLLMQYRNSDSPGAKPRRSAPLTDERIQLLNELGFTWTVRSRDSASDAWSQKLEELRQYVQQHGNALVPASYFENPGLGSWISTQRTQYRAYQVQKQGKGVSESTSMTEEKIRQLEELGMVWEFGLSTDQTFRKMMVELVQFRDLHQHVAVPSSYRFNPGLGEWASQQRTAYISRQLGKESELDDEKFAELEALGFLWEEPSADIMAEVDRVAEEPPDPDSVHPMEFSYDEEGGGLTQADEQLAQDGARDDGVAMETTATEIKIGGEAESSVTADVTLSSDAPFV